MTLFQELQKYRPTEFKNKFFVFENNKLMINSKFAFEIYSENGFPVEMLGDAFNNIIGKMTLKEKVIFFGAMTEVIK